MRTPSTTKLSYEELELLTAKMYIAVEPADLCTDEECDYAYRLAEKYDVLKYARGYDTEDKEHER